nr:mitochondrial Homoaconitase [Polyrhizophydium stewartii]
MAQVVMENYDPLFASMVHKNDILVGGFNFGTGSSREQAATALLHAGIRIVLAGSFSETFKRNAINNGLLVLEAPQLVRDLRARAAAAASGASGSATARRPTERTGVRVHVDLVRGLVSGAAESDGAHGVMRQAYSVARVGRAAQELVVAGGLEAWVRQRVQS